MKDDDIHVFRALYRAHRTRAARFGIPKDRFRVYCWQVIDMMKVSGTPADWVDAAAFVADQAQLEHGKRQARMGMHEAALAFERQVREQKAADALVQMREEAFFKA